MQPAKNFQIHFWPFQILSENHWSKLRNIIVHILVFIVMYNKEYITIGTAAYIKMSTSSLGKRNKNIISHNVFQLLLIFTAFNVEI